MSSECSYMSIIVSAVVVWIGVHSSVPGQFQYNGQ